MEINKSFEIISKYYRAVCDAYRLGNVESSYNAPIMVLFTEMLKEKIYYAQISVVLPVIYLANAKAKPEKTLI